MWEVKVKRIIFLLVEDELSNVESAIKAISEISGFEPVVHRAGKGNFYTFDRPTEPLHVFVAMGECAAFRMKLCLDDETVSPDYILLDLNFPSDILSTGKLLEGYSPKPFGFPILFDFLKYKPRGAVMITSARNHGGSMLPDGRHEIDGVPVEFVADENEVKDWLTPLRRVWSPNPQT